MLFLSVRIMISALFVGSDCYDDEKRALCCFQLLQGLLARSAFFFTFTIMFSALWVDFDCYDNDYCAVCFFLL